jgi:ribosome-associated protein
MIRVNDSISIDDSEIKEEFVRSSGPGGQNVNKVATAVQLRFDLAGSPSMPADVRRRLKLLARNRITEEGILVIEARRFRTQAANRSDALERLLELIRRAAQKPKPRRRTKPTLASKERRLESKKLRSRTKKLRRPISGEF